MPRCARGVRTGPSSFNNFSALILPRSCGALRRVHRKEGHIARKSKTAQVFLGQHLALSLAAHLARTQLVRDPLASYDAQHDRELLNVIGSALARTARIYLTEMNGAAPRELTQPELDGARAKNGATLLLLKDGRNLSGASIKRSDLQDAITILRALGIAELGGPPVSQQNVNASTGAAFGQHEELRGLLTQMEALLVFPLIPAQVERANILAVSLARSAPDGRISNLAMHLMSAVHEARRGDNHDNVRMMLARLRTAVDDLASAS
jgi:hypothetical protein